MKSAAVILALYIVATTLVAAKPTTTGKPTPKTPAKLHNPLSNVVDVDTPLIAIKEPEAQTVEANPTTALPDVKQEEKEEFPDRDGFITGHRIPLELFPQETLERIDLIAPHDTRVNPDLGILEGNLRAYVDSDWIRQGAPSPQGSERRDLLLELDQLVGERDNAYYNTRTTFWSGDY